MSTLKTIVSFLYFISDCKALGLLVVGLGDKTDERRGHVRLLDRVGRVSIDC